MTDAANNRCDKPLAAPRGDGSRRFILAKHPWLPFVFPWAVFMLFGCLEPRKGPADGTAAALAIGYRYYPVVYTLKIAFTLLAILLVLPPYKKFPRRVTSWGLLVGVCGAVVWVGMCGLQLESRFLPPLGLDWLVSLGRRSAYNPFQELGAAHAIWAWTFLVVRLFGLVVLVPIVEELFLRGFLMRFCVRGDWWNVPFGTLNRSAAVVAVLYGVLTHPAELIAAAVWFALVTWLMVKTKSLWDCVLAHAVTNAFLGVYVLTSARWELM